MKAFEALLDEVRDRTTEMDPIDRRTRLDGFLFRAPNQAGALAKLVPLSGEGTVLSLPVLNLSPLAISQLFERVGYSAKIAERLPAAFVEQDVNWLMQHQGDDRMALIRTVAGDSARAILGSRYTPLDDVELLSVAADYLHGTEVVVEALTDTTSHLTVTWPDELPGGLRRGLHIANSEVGLRAVLIEGILWRRVCSNVLPAVGLGGSSGFGFGSDGRLYRARSARAHDLTGAERGEVRGGWRFIHTGDPQRLRDFVRDAVADTYRQVDVLAERWQAGLSRRVDDAIGAIEALAGSARLTREQVRSALASWAITRPDFGDTVTGVANAFTLAAQREEDPEQRWYVQGVGTEALIGLN